MRSAPRRSAPLRFARWSSAARLILHLFQTLTPCRRSSRCSGLAIGFRPHQRAQAHDCVSRPLGGPPMQKCNRPTSTGMEPHPARTFGEEARKRERVRCSSLVDWQVYPRLPRTMQASTRSRNKPMRQGRISQPSASIGGLSGAQAEKGRRVPRLRLSAMRRRGEDVSDVILRLVKDEITRPRWTS